MKKLLLFLYFLLIISCQGDHVDKPKNLIDKDKMAETLTELVLNEQISYVVANNDLENGVREALKSNGVNPKDFVESYKYYVTTNQMKGIVEDAQKSLLKKDPEAAKFIKEKDSIINPQRQDLREIELERPLEISKEKRQRRRQQ